jgi:ribosomal protein L37AE/L43A
VKEKLVLRLREGGNISIVCSVCGINSGKKIHCINGVWVCEDCYPGGKTYDDEDEGGYYPFYGVPDGGSTITWCPMCNRQADVESIGNDWFYHDLLTGCGCTFTKIDVKPVSTVGKKAYSGVHKYDRRLKKFV